MRTVSWIALALVVMTAEIGLAQEKPELQPGTTREPQSAVTAEARADEPRAEVKRMDPVVISATKVETPQERLGASVSVVTDGEISTFNYDRIEEALRQLPGLDIQRAGSRGKTTSIRIRGAGTQQVQILVDGMRVKSPTLGQADLAEFTLDAIERIEVVRGPQSTIHGADAIGGVVNIITKKGAGPPHGYVHVEGGSYNTFREQVGVLGSYERFNFNVSGSRLDTAGNLDNDDAEQTSVAARLGYDFPWKGELSLTGRYSKLTLDLPVSLTSPTPPFTVFDPNARNDLETYFFNLTYTQPIVEWWKLSARYGEWHNTSGFRDSPPPPGDDVTTSQIYTERREAELLNTFEIGKWNTLTLGAEYRNEFGRNHSTGTFPTRFARTINTVSVFAQNELRLFDRLFLGGGIRREDNDVFGAVTTGRASAALVIKETGTKLRFAWGEGFRAPTVNDLFFPGFANPNLEPERSVSWEVGADQKLWTDRVRLGVTYFHNDFENLIQFRLDPGTGLFLPFNVGKARTDGVEVYGEIDPVDWLTLYANYTYTDTEDLATGLELRRFPRHRGNVGVTARPIDRLSLFAQAIVVGSQLEFPGPGVRNPGYHRIDVGGTYRLLGRKGALERLELTARVENLTNERYAEVFGFPALGVNVLAGLKASFR